MATNGQAPGTGRKDLVIVESPAKAKTINQYLGPNFVVRASVGHVRDLPRKGMGVNLETFEPEYEIIEGKGKVITELRKLAKDADTVWLATDLDREGEAIAWHIKEALKLKDDRVRRVVFNAITKAEIERAFARPGTINIDRVNAQQARRILDRVVGFEISPVLWRKVSKGLSAGRVQSVAVRLVVDRERAIEAFDPEEYWKIGGVFRPADDGMDARDDAIRDDWRAFLTSGEDGAEPSKKDQAAWLASRGAFAADLVEFNGAKFEPSDADAAAAVAKHLGLDVSEIRREDNAGGRGAAARTSTVVGRLGMTPAFRVERVETKRQKSNPPAPFITSTLQQAASGRLGFGASRTMRLAQTLYEAGHITYMRTDSTAISGDAVAMARGHIGRAYGEKYLPERPNSYASRNKSAQEAHEAVRPTDVIADAERLAGKVGPDETRLYRLIWERFVACQMTPALFDQTAVTVACDTGGGRAVFRATGRKLVFDGFMRVTGVTAGDPLLPDLPEGRQLDAVDVRPTEHFTSPPARFNEASLVKELESLGIGRPSTYASIIDTIQKREYVIQQNRAFYATLLGKVVTDKLMQGFPDIMDVGFTADMEDKLDGIEDRGTDWIELLRGFYGPFHERIGKAMQILEHAGGAASPYVDEETGTPLVYRIGSSGFFLASSDPAVKVTKPVDPFGVPAVREQSGFICPRSGHPMTRRKGRFGEYLSCSGYPECEFLVPINKKGEPDPPKIKAVATGIPCEKCGSEMVLRDSKRGPFLGCGSFPKCRSTMMARKLPPDQLAHLNTLLPELRRRVEESHHLAAMMLGRPADTFGPLPADHIDADEPATRKKPPAKKFAAKTGKKPGVSAAKRATPRASDAA